MDFAPITCGDIDFKKCDLLHGRYLLGIDCGSLLTKVIFFHKDNQVQLADDKINFVTFTHGLFSNINFKEGIIWTLEQAYLPKDVSYSIHITGSNALNQKELVESIFELKVVYVDEMLSVIAGHRIALERMELENLKAPSVNIELGEKVDSKFLEKFTKALSSKIIKDPVEKSSKIFPCLLNVFSSLTRMYYFDEDGKGQMLGCPLEGSRSFMGLAKCLLDINNYDEIIELASTGNRGNVDTQVKDILLGNINSPYGNLPPERPIFSFGKSMDFNKGLEDYKKEDVASSLISYFARNILTFNVQGCLMKRTRKVFVTGNLFRSDLFEKSIKKILMIFQYDIQFEFLEGVYFRALGAMFCNNEEKRIYCKD